jgi:methylmalonyl-CoA mutase
MAETVTGFPDTSKEDWIGLLTKELKGASIDTLTKHDEIEGLTYPSYFHRTDKLPAFSDPGFAPFVRGTKNTINEWLISCPVYFREDSKEDELNKYILDQLMKGSAALYIIVETERTVDFKKLLNEVQFEFIYTSLEAKTPEQLADFKTLVGNYPSSAFCSGKTASDQIVIDAYSAQQAGANSIQQLVVALGEGHDAIVKKLEAGQTIDEACKNIQFNFGIGTKYLIEIAKFRAFRWCWSTLIDAYKPEHNCTSSARIVAKSGFTHMSLHDPSTNLLRLTTQAMSAVNGGIDELIIQPYDAYSSEFNPAFTQRMVTNISLLLQEESFLSQVKDVAGGSYAIDFFTKELASKAWAKFQALEAKGGLSNVENRTALSADIKETAELRIARLQEKKDKLIGVNCFPNPRTEVGTWQNVPEAWNGLSTLLLEQSL